MASRQKHFIVGKKFDRLLVLEKLQKQMYLCQCDCGNQKPITCSALVSGSTKSCGCLHAESVMNNGKKNRRHGYATTSGKARVWLIWESMKRRCKGNDSAVCKRYGMRGIRVCERWEIFENFLADMGEPPDGASIDRIDNNGNYEPSNCRWATAKEQGNNRENNLRLSFNNETKTLQQWADSLGIDRSTIRRRLKRKWSVEEALSIPVNSKFSPKRKH